MKCTTAASACSDHYIRADPAARRFFQTAELRTHISACKYCQEIDQVQQILLNDAQKLAQAATLAHPSAIVWRAETARRFREAEKCALPLLIAGALILLLAIVTIGFKAVTSVPGSSECFLSVSSVPMTVVVAVNWWRARVSFHRDVPKTNYSGFMSRFAFLLCLLGVSALAAEGPEFDDQGRLKFPANYREWIFLSSGLGMTYGPAASAATAANPLFDNVFVNPPAWAEFKKTGKWPEGTVFVLEIRKSTSNGSINKGGHFQSDTSAIEVEVKDTKRYPRGWAFYDFRVGAAVAAPLGTNTSCHGCHSTNGAVENTFVQFYPTALPIAKAKGTVKADVKETN